MSHQPVAFEGAEYIRVGSYKKKLRDFPEKERALWAVFSETVFETEVALPSASSDEVLASIDYVGTFRLLDIPLPDNRRAILERLSAERVIIPRPADRFDITNVGAVLFAADLRYFQRLSRKVPRVVIYQGENKTQTVKEHPASAADVPRPGYAVGFESLLAWINDQLPQNEHVGQALRKTVRLYPEVAIRELVANALIHQDFNLSGTRFPHDAPAHCCRALCATTFRGYGPTGAHSSLLSARMSVARLGQAHDESLASPTAEDRRSLGDFACYPRHYSRGLNSPRRWQYKGRKLCPILGVT